MLGIPPRHYLGNRQFRRGVNRHACLAECRTSAPSAHAQRHHSGWEAGVVAVVFRQRTFIYCRDLAMVRLFHVHASSRGAGRPLVRKGRTRPTISPTSFAVRLSVPNSD